MALWLVHTHTFNPKSSPDFIIAQHIQPKFHCLFPVWFFVKQLIFFIFIWFQLKYFPSFFFLNRNQINRFLNAVKNYDTWLMWTNFQFFNFIICQVRKHWHFVANLTSNSIINTILSKETKEFPNCFVFITHQQKWRLICAGDRFQRLKNGEQILKIFWITHGIVEIAYEFCVIGTCSDFAFTKCHWFKAKPK